MEELENQEENMKLCKAITIKTNISSWLACGKMRVQLNLIQKDDKQPEDLSPEMSKRGKIRCITVQKENS